MLQPICLSAELSLKAAIVQAGGDPEGFWRRGEKGPDIVALAGRLAQDTPHRDDGRIVQVVATMPPYVDSRYAPAGLTRLQVVRLALEA